MVAPEMVGVIVNGTAAVTHGIGFLAHHMWFQSGDPSPLQGDNAKSYTMIQMMIWIINMCVRIPGALNGGAPMFVRGSMASFATAYAVLFFAAMTWNGQADPVEKPFDVQKFADIMLYYAIATVFFFIGLFTMMFKLMPALGVNTLTSALMFITYGSFEFCGCAMYNNMKLEGLLKTPVDEPAKAWAERNFSAGHLTVTTGMALLAWDAYNGLKASREAPAK